MGDVRENTPPLSPGFAIGDISPVPGEDTQALRKKQTTASAGAIRAIGQVRSVKA
jgi:hypothetical protein